MEAIMYQTTDENKQRLQALLATAIELVEADRGGIMFPDPETGEPEMKISQNYVEHINEYFQVVQFAVARYVIEKGPLATFNHPYGQDEYGIPAEPMTYDSCIKSGLRSLIGVPIHFTNNVIGVLYA